MNHCRLITSPISKERVTSKTWDDLYRLSNKNPQEADRLYQQLVSPEFISWFGNWIDEPEKASKVVNDLGEPLVVYHASKEKFEEFKKDKISDNEKWGDNEGPFNKIRFLFQKPSSFGFFFTNDRSYVDDGQKNIYPVFLDIKNPLTALSNEEPKFWSTVRTDDFDGAIWNDKLEMVVYEPNQIKSVNNSGKFDNRMDNIYLQQYNAGVETNEQTETKVKNFLASIGVSVEKVNEIRDESGKPLDAVAKADMLNGIIQVVDGKADISTLPEEAAHFFVEMLGEDNPLFKQMFKDITKYKLYEETVQSYKDTKDYRNTDGSINFPKLKKEAIGKVISHIIVAKETGSEYPEQIAKAQSWWEKVWKFVTNILKKVTNPFEESVSSILGGNTKGLKKIGDFSSDEQYYQLENNYSKIKTDQQRIHLDDSIDPKTGEKKHIYTVDGKPVVDKNGTPRSVTSVEVDKWYKDKFPTDNRDNRQKNIDSLKAEEGSKIHSDAESIITRYVDSSTGELRAVPLPVDSIGTTQSVYDKLDTYIGQILRSYNPGTKFMTEVRLYDSKKNLAGSIDLLAMLPDDSVDIYDWKSQEVSKGHTDLKWFKEPAYRIQLNAYRRILTQEYGITKFNKVRAIPISTIFQYRKENGNFTPTRVSDIEIGSTNPRDIPTDKSYLLPVVAQDESTGDAELDKLIQQLNGVYDRISNQDVGKDRYIKAEELNKIKKAIRDLQVKQDITSFVENGLAEVNKYREKLDNDTITTADVLESKEILNVYKDAGILLENQLIELNKKIKAGQNVDELEKVQSDFLKMVGNANSVANRMDRKMKELGVKIAEKEGISDLLQSERTMDKLKATFRSLSTLPTRAIKTFYKLLSTAQTKRDIEIEHINEHLGTLKSDLEKWAKAKGILNKNMFDGILKFDKEGNWTGQFLDKYSKDFHNGRDKAIREGDAKWIMEHMNFDEVGYETALKSYKDRLETVVYSTNAQINQERRDKALDKWVESRDVRKSDIAKFNKKNYFLSPKDTWQSEKWKDLLKNAPLKAAYDYFQELKKKSDGLGMIEFDSGFVPSVYQDKLELATFNGLANIFNNKGLFESLQTNSDKFFGEIDPLTGELVKKIPVQFLNDLGVERPDGTMDYKLKSKDLFKVFSVWGGHTSNYEAMQSIKDSAELLVEVERSKKSLITNLIGNVTKDKKEKVGNDPNADVLERFVRYYVYGQKNEGGSDYVFKVGDKEYSAVKTVRGMVNLMSLKTLGLNTLSGTSTFVGGSGNAFFQASKHGIFNEGDWANGFRDFTSRDPKLMGAMGFFDVGLEDMKREENNRLSVSSIVKYMTLDQLFFIQRAGDKAVQYPVLGAMLRTHMVENGEIVDINKFVKAKYDYNNTFYNLSKAEQKVIRSKIDAEVGELKKTRSLEAVATVVNDKYGIPGVDHDSKTASDFRAKVRKVNKNIIGNATHEDINQLRMTMLGQVLMQFRSWMPQMFIERLGDMTYDVDMDSYQYGKARLFFKHFADKKVLPLIGELLTGFSGNTIQKAKSRYVEFKGRMDNQGEEFNMSEGEFIDMYLGSLRSMLRELIFVAGFTSLLFWVKPGDDDDDKTGVRKYLARAANKYQNEFAFFYSPSEFTQMIKSPVPIVGLLTDFQRFFTGTIGQMYGFATQNEELMDKSHPLTTMGKILPITKEAQSMYALFDDDFAKQWGIINR